MKSLKTIGKWFPLLAIALLGFLAWQQGHLFLSRERAQSQTYQVLKVSDGDTITVRSMNTGEEARIRFACIDAPEVAHGNQPGQPVGQESKANLKRLIDRAGGKVMVQAVDRDRYGRIVGEVFASARNPQQPEEEVFLNAEQVRSGMAYVYRKYASSCSQVAILEDLEKGAKAARKGVWARDDQKPWDYRRSQR